MRKLILLLTFLICSVLSSQNIEQKPIKSEEMSLGFVNDTLIMPVLDEETKLYDSIKRENKFSLIQLIIGYKHQRPHKNETYKYNGLLSTFAFNAVQGFNVTTGLSYLKERPADSTYYEVGGLVNYGIAENKPRFSGYFSQLLNSENQSKITVSGGLTVHQFGEDFPVKKIINSLASSYFGKNYAKFYQKDFIALHYQQSFSEHFLGTFGLEYAHRRTLFNHTLRSPFVKRRIFTSNNPIDSTNFEDAGFESNNIVKLKVKTVVHFNQNHQLPVVYFNIETGFASNLPKYNYALVGFSTLFQQSFETYGNLAAFVNAGWFINAQNIAFMDYKHFYGNETFIETTKNYLQNFNLLPYYAYSTNKSFAEWHAEYDFNGFLTDAVPHFGKLQWHLITGAHVLHTYGQHTYYELSIGLNNIGFKKFRPLRVDFFQSFNGFKTESGIIIGIKILDV